jgi:chromosome segregation ATPase
VRALAAVERKLEEKDQQLAELHRHASETQSTEQQLQSERTTLHELTQKLTRDAAQTWPEPNAEPPKSWLKHSADLRSARDQSQQELDKKDQQLTELRIRLSRVRTEEHRLLSERAKPMELATMLKRDSVPTSLERNGDASQKLLDPPKMDLLERDLLEWAHQVAKWNRKLRGLRNRIPYEFRRDF